MFTDIYDMITDIQFVNTLEDCVRELGAMSKSISDSTKVETGTCALEIIHILCISDWQSEQ